MKSVSGRSMEFWVTDGFGSNFKILMPSFAIELIGLGPLSLDYCEDKFIL